MQRLGVERTVSRRSLMGALGGLTAAAVLAQGARADDSDDIALDVLAERPPAPPLALADLDGRLHDLVELRGQAVLVNFWATWCAPCVAEMAALQRLHARPAQDGGVTVLAVNAGDSADKVRRFLSAHPLTLPILLDASTRTAVAWRVGGLPTSYVVDSAGALAAEAVGARDWDSAALRAVLTEMTQQRH